MGALSSMNDTFHFISKRYADLLIPALEGFLILMALQVLMIPVMLFMMFPMIFLSVSPGVTAIFIMVIIMIVIYVIALVAGHLAMGIMMGGTVRAVDAIRNHEKVEFGYVFKYGWKNKWELFTIQILNYFLMTIIMIVVLAVSVGVGVLVMSLISPMIGLLIIILSYLALIMMAYASYPLMYLPFVIRHKRGTYGASNIVLAWKEYFGDIVSYGSMGLLYLLLFLLLMMIPVINMLVSLAMHVVFISTILTHYDEKYRIPVKPAVKWYPPMGSYQPDIN